MKLEQNPPAFPVELGFDLEPGEPHQTGETIAQFPGMTLRDWFAGQALVGGMSNADPHNFATPAQCATMAYQISDAMLVERRKAIAAATGEGL